MSREYPVPAGAAPGAGPGGAATPGGGADGRGAGGGGPGGWADDRGTGGGGAGGGGAARPGPPGEKLATPFSPGRGWPAPSTPEALAAASGWLLAGCAARWYSAISAPV